MFSEFFRKIRSVDFFSQTPTYGVYQKRDFEIELGIWYHHAAEIFENYFFVLHDTMNVPPNFCAFLLSFHEVTGFSPTYGVLVGISP